METPAYELMDTPVVEIMSTKLVTVIPTDPLSKVKEIFDTYKIHHVPVVRFTNLVGVISKSDFYELLHSLRLRVTGDEESENKDILNSHTAEELMTKNIVKVKTTDRIGVAADIFLRNYFHAVPVVDEQGALKGILTTYDMIKHFFKMAYPSRSIETFVK